MSGYPLQAYQPQQERELITTTYQQIEQKEQEEQTYNNYVQYLFSLIGFCVGFGSFWRFPYLIYRNGGGAFLIPFFTFLALVSIPMNYLEVAVGQLGRLSLPTVYESVNRGLKLFGLAQLLMCFTFLGYLNILIVYSLRFLVIAISSNPQDMQSLKNEPISENQFFEQVVLQKSDSILSYGSINLLHVVLYFLSTLAIYLIVKNGVKTSGKITIATAIIPYVIFTIMLVRGLFLPGAISGLKVLFYPDFTKLGNLQIWTDALNQALYITGVSQTTVIAFSSLKPKSQRVKVGVYVVPMSLILCGFMCASIVYIYIGNHCFLHDIAIESLHLEGFELSFSIFPKILMEIPAPRLWLFLFFSAMVFLGIDTQFGLFEAFCCYIDNSFKHQPSKVYFSGRLKINASRMKLIGALSIGCWALLYCASSGIYFVGYFDSIGTAIPQILGTFIEIVILIYIIPVEETLKLIEIATSETVPKWIGKILMSPLLITLISVNLLVVILHQMEQWNQYPTTLYAVGWLYSLGPYIVSLGYFSIYCEQDWRTSYSEIFSHQNQIESHSVIDDDSFEKQNRIDD